MRRRAELIHQLRGNRRPSGTGRDQAVTTVGATAGRGAAPARTGVGRLRG